jgi:hypothetical protein
MPDALDRLKQYRLYSIAASVGLFLILVAISAPGAEKGIPEWVAMGLVGLFLAALVAFLVLNAKVRAAAKRAAPAAAPPVDAPKPVPALRTMLLLAAGWFLLDAFLFQQGLISLILIFLSVIWMVPSAIMARKDPPLRRFRAGRAAAYFIAAALALGVIAANIRMVTRRAHVVASAIENYHQKRGDYPQKLDDLAPEFLPSVPAARYALTWNRFDYFYSPGATQTPTFGYVVIPPFGRMFYSFQSKTWHQLD